MKFFSALSPLCRDRPAYAKVSLDLDWAGFEIGSDQGEWGSELDYIDW